MKGKALTRVLLVTLAITTLLCGTAFALMFRQTATLQNQFEAARVDCLVHEKLDDGVVYTNGTHQTEQKTSIRVQNTGNIEAYIRLRFVSYWVDVNGNIIGKPSQMPEIQYDTSKWIKGDAADDYTYYYKLPVLKDGFTDELLKTPIKLQGDTENGHFQVVEVFADAIQSQPVKAAANSWKVTIDSNGNITGVS